MIVYFIITGNNCYNYLDSCFQSVLSQTSDKWYVIFIDDASIDNSVKLANTYKINHKEKFTILKNEKRSYKSFGFLKAIDLIPKNAIVAELDADDTLLTNVVVEDLIKFHLSYDVVYTNHVTTNCSTFPWTTWRSTALPLNWSRTYPERDKVWSKDFFPGHLRTFKRKLFDAINRDIFYYDGELLKVAFDLVYYTSIIEMTPHDKICFLDKDYYHYLVRNKNDEFKENDLVSKGIKELHKKFCQTEIDKWFKDTTI